MQASWLLADGLDRDRMLEMDRRIRPQRRIAFAVLAVALLVCGPWLGYWTVVPLGMAAILFRVAEAHNDRSARPEFGLFAAWSGSQVVIAISVALTGGAETAMMSWFALPIVTLGSRFSGRGIRAGVAVTLGLMFTVAFGVDAQHVIDNPPALIGPVALVIASALLVSVLMHSDVATRAEAIIDPLTGLLNRKALAVRAAELTEQSRTLGQPVGIVLGDLDCFKSINDTHGHATGDAVLTGVAYILRKELRAFDAVYRLGGEEFLVLVPGAGQDHAAEVAERLRAAVEAEPLAEGLRVTISFGVSSSPAGEAFDYDREFARADAALYAAKSAGRNRVMRATAGTATDIASAAMSGSNGVR